ncbi:undecaprenyldiphospho-muramoylpentapeptide beta-N-acetylglucosaminyltransferase [Dongshaea marina]|uniref:undecaprenyldiphospho-muramoylpentapeptide beta-N-acetylglucosaminyltransferase n=1 Tax=Dongshaea marina TaxID=2047966 RepID=UPI000D3E5230|nr:undecaprenyldiphospho-muramoylpentapeptide beta-N-acetylglucosaminyltransferase [Dongshaea marina]
MSKRTLLVMAGGTGGHVFPGLAVADYLKQQGWDIHWLGTRERLEAQLVPEHGYPISFIEIKALRGQGLKSKLQAPWKLLKALGQARRVIKAIKPDVVLGMGGFASGPGGVAARLAGIPLVLHEQNAAAGMTNRLLSKIATRVLEAFPNTFQNSPKLELVGNPVRQAMIDIPAPQERLDLSRKSLRVLVIGGSQGAKVLNETLPQAVANIADLEIRHQCGKGQQQSVSEAYYDLGVKTGVQANVTVLPFIKDMAAAYTWADLLICRAGALTVAEVSAAGVAAIFVPFAAAVDDHQTKNARQLVRAGAALLIPQAELTAELLSQKIAQLAQDRPQILDMATKARQQAITDATKRVANVCQKLVAQEID